MPGISPKVADVARRVAGAGATAVLPSLFGVDGRDPRPDNLGAVGWSLSPEQIAEKFDLAYHTQHVDTIFRRVFGES